MTTESDLTVVVVALLGDEALARCVAGFDGQDCRIITVGNALADGSETVTVPQLRLQALRAAATHYVGFIEDTALPSATWCAAVRTALATASAVAGPILVSPDLAPRYRALGLSEYAKYQPAGGGSVGVSAGLPGLNFAVRRDVALALAKTAEHGLFEGDLAARLGDVGAPVAWSPEMTATYREPHPQGAALTTRFHHGRLFAARRVAGRPFAVRWAYALATMVLPALMSVRALRHVPATLGVTPATLGWVAAMSTAWAGGEFVGYATGSIGRSLDSWR